MPGQNREVEGRGAQWHGGQLELVQQPLGERKSGSTFMGRPPERRMGTTLSPRALMGATEEFLADTTDMSASVSSTVYPMVRVIRRSRLRLPSSATPVRPTPGMRPEARPGAGSDA